jgi:hypothetical protein
MEPLARCDNGHYYDSKRHVSCPFCGIQDLGLDIQKTMAKQVSGSSGYEIDITMPLREGFEAGRDSSKTRGIDQVEDEFEPVSGWLIAISGPARGRDFRITSERNFIGRSEEMEIRITKDEYVSRENHAAVSYSPKNHTFRIYPGDSRGLTYLNDLEVLAPELLEPYDIVEVGKTQLMFVPFCGDRFNWKKKIDQRLKDSEEEPDEE